MSFTYPTSQELFQIEQERLPRLQAGRAVFDFFRITTKDAAIVSWEQKDSYTGLQQVRGYGGSPSRVKRVAGRRYTVEPGIYGEYIPLDEIELTTRRAWGSFATPVKIDDLVMEASEQLQTRFLDRLEFLAWNTCFGSISVLGPTGVVMHQDQWSPLTQVSLVQWSSAATATPIGDFRSIGLLSRGRSTSFGNGAKAYMNKRTFNWLVANINSADLYGKRTAGLANVMTLDQINMVLAGEDLPMIVIYDQGYLVDPAANVAVSAALFTPFIPDHTVVVIGTRPGNAAVCEYIMTRNVNNADMAPGQYTRVIDLGENRIPRSIEVHNGHNGAPAIMYPGSVVIMTV